VSIWTQICDSILNFISLVRISDFVDIALVAFIIYKLIKLVYETRAQQLIKGILVLLLVTVASEWLHLNTINYILKNTLQFGALALLVVFQPELRRALEKMGRSQIFRMFFPSSNDDGENLLTAEIVKTAVTLSAQRTGALIVVEKNTKLGEIIKTGRELDAIVSSDLLINLFVPNTPLHDGAVIIRDGKIAAAACILPLTQNDSLSRELGTRHRAALGVSEMSDAAVVVVSEETGKISFACDGSMTRNLTADSLQKFIDNALYAESSKKDVTWKERLKWKK